MAVSVARRARKSAAQQVFDEVRAFCQANANPERARKYARYFTEGYDAYGVDHKAPEWEALRLACIERLRKAGPEALLEAGSLLFGSGKYEEGSFAILSAAGLPEFYTTELFDGLGRWFHGGVRNWGHTDVLCDWVLSRFVLDGIVTLDQVAEWRSSEWKFQRRAVPVMLIKALKTQPLAALQDVVAPLRKDKEKVVKQGIAWFDRQVKKLSA